MGNPIRLQHSKNVAPWEPVTVDSESAIGRLFLDPTTHGVTVWDKFGDAREYRLPDPEVTA